jgi:lipopolysaccharide export system protein LptA
MLVIAAFIGWTHYLTRLRHLKLPQRLGVNIVRETNGFTYSQSLQGKTVYTIHAAKAVEHTDGKVAMHDVSITLYGKKGDRADHIYGDEFEYDQKAGLVRATGLVHIDLQAAEKPAAELPAGLKGVASSAKVMHVTTSGLVYMEKLGVAATGEDIEFQAGGMTGHARGADYSSDSGVLMLHSAVRMEGVTAGRPMVLTAAAANLDNRNQEIFLTQATYASPGRTAAAGQATLHTRPDGTLARVEALGNVTMGANGATMVAQQADITLNAAGEPESAVLTHAVRYSADRPLSQVRGQADAATIGFDGQKKPQPQHAVFTGGVHMTERTRATNAAGEPWSSRELTAAKLDAVLGPAGPGRSELKDAEATGSPKLVLVDAGSLASGGGKGISELSADGMKAHLLAAADTRQSPQLDTIAARGHTVLRQVSADGTEQVSSGDVLDAKFRPQTSPAKGHVGAAVSGGRAGLPGGGKPADSLVSALQQGHVTMMRRKPAKAGAKTGEDVSHATAARAAYDGDADRMTLTGGVKVTDAGSALWANQVTLDKATGDSEALGGVKADYVEDSAVRNPPHEGEAAMNGVPGGVAEPTHFLADRAEMVHATDTATFHGKPVRMWRGGNQVLAPVIELERGQKRMIARSENSGGGPGGTQTAVVHTVLVRDSSANHTHDGKTVMNGAPGAGACAANPTRDGKAVANGAPSKVVGEQAPDVVRIASGGLVYSGLSREANFTGGLRAETVDGTIRATQGTAYMKENLTREGGAVMNGTAGGVNTVSSPEGSLERVVASGHVVIDQPGLQATGERLVYTANDQDFLLTGSADAPPKATGARGTTTGAALRLRHSCEGSGGDSVEVLGVVPGEPVQKVRTDSRISEGAKDKGKR